MPAFQVPSPRCGATYAAAECRGHPSPCGGVRLGTTQIRLLRAVHARRQALHRAAPTAGGLRRRVRHQALGTHKSDCNTCSNWIQYQSYIVPFILSVSDSLSIKLPSCGRRREAGHHARASFWSTRERRANAPASSSGGPSHRCEYARGTTQSRVYGLHRHACERAHTQAALPPLKIAQEIP